MPSPARTRRRTTSTPSPAPRQRRITSTPADSDKPSSPCGWPGFGSATRIPIVPRGRAVPMQAAELPMHLAAEKALLLSRVIADPYLDRVSCATEVATAERLPIPVRLASMRELAADGRVMPLNNLLGRGERPLAPDEAAGWVEGYDLLRECPVWVPADVVSLDPRGQDRRGSRY